MPELPRVARTSKGRTQRVRAPEPPVHIRAEGVALGPEDREYLRRKLGTKLGKFAASVERATVRIRDINGPKGGVDHVCRVKTVLRGLPSVVVESRAGSFRTAADLALQSAERTVRRTVQRRRTRPLRRAT